MGLFRVVFWCIYIVPLGVYLDLRSKRTEKKTEKQNSGEAGKQRSRKAEKQGKEETQKSKKTEKQ